MNDVFVFSTVDGVTLICCVVAVYFFIWSFFSKHEHISRGEKPSALCVLSFSSLFLRRKDDLLPLPLSLCYLYLSLLPHSLLCFRLHFASVRWCCCPFSSLHSLFSLCSSFWLLIVLHLLCCFELFDFLWSSSFFLS